MHSTLSSDALQNRLTACLSHCNYTYESLLLIQVCTDPSPKHCSPGFGKLHSPLSSAALQNRLTACLCHRNHTYEYLLLTQVCTDPPPMHCSTDYGKCIPHCPVLLCKTGSQHACVAAITPMKACCSHKCALIHHQCTAALIMANAFPTVQCCPAK